MDEKTERIKRLFLETKAGTRECIKEFAHEVMKAVDRLGMPEPLMISRSQRRLLLTNAYDLAAMRAVNAFCRFAESADGELKELVNKAFIEPPVWLDVDSQLIEQLFLTEKQEKESFIKGSKPYLTAFALPFSKLAPIDELIDDGINELTANVNFKLNFDKGGDDGIAPFVYKESRHKIHNHLFAFYPYHFAMLATEKACEKPPKSDDDEKLIKQTLVMLLNSDISVLDEKLSEIIPLTRRVLNLAEGGADEKELRAEVKKLRVLIDDYYIRRVVEGFRYNFTEDSFNTESLLTTKIEGLGRRLLSGNGDTLGKFIGTVIPDALEYLSIFGKILSKNVLIDACCRGLIDMATVPYQTNYDVYEKYTLVGRFVEILYNEAADKILL